MKRIISVLLILNILMSGICMFSSCKSEKSDENTIVDMAGASIKLPENINKVICTPQNALEFMVAMGLEEKIIGVHKSIFVHTWSKEYIKTLDKLGRFGYSPTAEAVYESGADLVIVRDATTAENLRNAGITAITFKYGNKDEMFAAIRMLGKIFGKSASDYAEKWINKYNETCQLINAKVSKLSDDKKIKAYFLNASGALDSTGLTTTVGGDNIVSEWFDTIGVNLVTKEYTNISSINEEKILEINPEAIVIGGWCENTRKEQLLSDAKWANVEAVKNRNIFLVPVGFVSFERYAVEAPILLMYSASLMYPELFEYDTVTEFKAFFSEYFGIEVSEEKIGYMLNGYSPDGSRMD